MTRVLVFIECCNNNNGISLEWSQPSTSFFNPELMINEENNIMANISIHATKSINNFKYHNTQHIVCVYMCTAAMNIAVCEQIWYLVFLIWTTFFMLTLQFDLSGSILAVGCYVRTDCIPIPVPHNVSGSILAVGC